MGHVGASRHRPVGGATSRRRRAEGGGGDGGRVGGEPAGEMRAGDGRHTRAAALLRCPSPCCRSGRNRIRRRPRLCRPGPLSPRTERHGRLPCPAVVTCPAGAIIPREAPNGVLTSYSQRFPARAARRSARAGRTRADMLAACDEPWSAAHLCAHFSLNGVCGRSCLTR
jgi:hypothetical protein